MTGEERRFADPAGEASPHLACTVEMTNVRQECEYLHFVWLSLLFTICRPLVDPILSLYCISNGHLIYEEGGGGNKKN